MPGRILQEDIEALKRHADIAEVVSDHTKLKRSGSRMKGLCPLHQERTPSFSVDPGMGMWHCFGCQEGGDVYTFLERVEGLSFVEAVEHLARRVGYQLRYEEMSAGQKRALGRRTQLVAANRAALGFYREQLLSPAGEMARTYLKERGFGREEAERFLLGFAPLEWDALSNHLRAERFAEDDLVDAGLAVRNQRGGLRDRFRGRLLFPVLDRNEDPIGFGGRVLPDLDYGDHEPPKYLNTAETPIYRKHEVLYGMSWARPEMVRESDVLVCEGYTDVMALHQAGFTNSVATCGTAVTEDHLRALERYVERVVLAFDADEAGKRAAERANEIARDRDLEVRVLMMPEGQDPADVVRDGGAEAMRELVDGAEPVLRFTLRRALEGHDDSPEGRARAIEAAGSILAEVREPVLRDQYTRWVADQAGVGLPVVAEAVGTVAPGAAPVVPAQQASPPTLGTSPRDASARAQLEREVLRVALQRADLLPERWGDVTEDDFVHPKGRAVFRAIRAVGGPGAPADRIVEEAEDDDVRGLVRAICLEEFTVEPDEPHVEMTVGRLLLHRLESEIAWRKDELERMNPTTDPAAYRDRFEALITLEAKRRDLRDVASG